MDFITPTNLNIVNFDMLQLGLHNASMFSFDMLLLNNMLFVNNELFYNNIFFYYWGHYGIFNNNFFFYEDYYISLLLLFWCMSDNYNKWIYTINAVNIDLINELRILDDIRYAIESDFWVYYPRKKVNILNFRNWRTHKDFEDDDELNMSILLTHNFKLLTDLGFQLGWVGYATTHQDCVNIMYLYQPSYIFLSNDSYIYYPLQANKYIYSETRYLPQFSYFDMTWFSRDTGADPDSEYIDLAKLREYDEYYLKWSIFDFLKQDLGLILLNNEFYRINMNFISNDIFNLYFYSDYKLNIIFFNSVDLIKKILSINKIIQYYTTYYWNHNFLWPVYEEHLKDVIDLMYKKIIPNFNYIYVPKYNIYKKLYLDNFFWFDNYGTNFYYNKIYNKIYYKDNLFYNYIVLCIGIWFIWFLIYFIIHTINNIYKFIYIIFTNLFNPIKKNIKKFIKYVYKRVFVIRVFRWYYDNDEILTFIWSNYRDLYKKSSNKNLAAHFRSLGRLVKNRHNIKSWLIFHKRIYLYTLFFFYLNLIFRILFFFMYLFFEFFFKFFYLFMKNVPFFIFESVYKLVLFYKQILFLFTQNIISLWVYKNICSFIIYIKSIFTIILFLPTHFYLFLTLNYLMHREYYYAKSTNYLHYPLDFSILFKKLLRYIYPLYNENIAVSSINYTRIFIFSILNIIFFKSTTYILSRQTYITPILNFNMLIFIYICTNIYWVFNLLYSKIITILNLNFLSFIYKSILYLYNNLIEKYYIMNLYIFYMIKKTIYNMIYIIINLIKFIIYIPFICIFRFKYLVFFYILSSILLDYDFLLNFIIWSLSIAPLGNIISFIREADLLEYIILTTLDAEELRKASVSILGRDTSHVIHFDLYTIINDMLFDYNQPQYFDINDYIPGTGIQFKIFIGYKIVGFSQHGFLRTIVTLLFSLDSYIKWKILVYINWYLNKNVFIFLLDFSEHIYKYYFWFTYYFAMLKYIIFQLKYYITFIWLYFVPWLINKFFNFNILYIMYDNIYFSKNIFIKNYTQFNKYIWVYIYYKLLDLINICTYTFDTIILFITSFVLEIYNYFYIENIVEREDYVLFTNYENSHSPYFNLFGFLPSIDFFGFLSRTSIIKNNIDWNYFINLDYFKNNYNLIIIMQIFMYDLFNLWESNYNYWIKAPIYFIYQYMMVTMFILISDSINDLMRFLWFKDNTLNFVCNFFEDSTWQLGASEYWLLSFVRIRRQTLFYNFETMLSCNFSFNFRNLFVYKTVPIYNDNDFYNNSMMSMILYTHESQIFLCFLRGTYLYILYILFVNIDNNYEYNNTFLWKNYKFDLMRLNNYLDNNYLNNNKHYLDNDIINEISKEIITKYKEGKERVLKKMLNFRIMIKTCFKFKNISYFLNLIKVMKYLRKLKTNYKNRQILYLIYFYNSKNKFLNSINLFKQINLLSYIINHNLKIYDNILLLTDKYIYLYLSRSIINHMHDFQGEAEDRLRDWRMPSRKIWRKPHFWKYIKLSNLKWGLIEEADNSVFAVNKLNNQFDIYDLYYNINYDDLYYFKETNSKLWRFLVLKNLESDNNLDQIFLGNEQLLDDFDVLDNSLNKEIVEELKYYNLYYFYYLEFLDNSVKKYNKNNWSYYKDKGIETLSSNILVLNNQTNFLCNLENTIIASIFEKSKKGKKQNYLLTHEEDDLLKIENFQKHDKELLNVYFKEPIKIIPGEPMIPCAFLFFFYYFTLFTLFNHLGIRLREGHINAHEWWYMIYYFLPNIDFLYYYLKPMLAYDMVYWDAYESQLGDYDEAEYIRFIFNNSYWFSKDRDPFFSYHNIFNNSLKPIFAITSLNNFVYDLGEYIWFIIKTDICMMEISNIKNQIKVLFLLILFLFNLLLKRKTGITRINSNKYYINFVITTYNINKKKINNYIKKKNDIISKT